MSDPVFIQRSRLGRTTFQLRGDTLVLNALTRHGRGAQEIPLRSLDRDYDVRAVRIHLLYLWPLVVGVFCVSLVLLILRQDVVPHDVAIHPLIFLIPAALGFVRGLPRVEFFVFRDAWHQPLFFIVREKAQAAECDSFVQELLYRIERVEAGRAFAAEPAIRDLPASAVVVPAPREPGLTWLGENRWSAAITAGALSSMIPLVPWLASALEDVLLFVVLGFSFASLYLGVTSFLTKERMRFWALPGMALAFVAPLFYPVVTMT